jgi:DNA sulfur modification protein DndD
VRLKYLVICDIGPFRGRHIFDFSDKGEHSGYAFFAKNGRGKTTIYNAMKWALFGTVRQKSKLVNTTVVEGKNRPVVDETDQDNMLMNLDAWMDDTPQSMSVRFHAEGDFGELQVERTASCNSMARKDKDLDFSLNVSLGEDSFQEDSAAEQIGKIFPSELERFFFIDGEEVEAYTTMMKSSTNGIIDDIKSILRLPSLTRGIEDLKAVRRSYDEAIDADSKRQQRDSKRADKARNIQGQLSTVRKQVSELETEVKRLITRRDKFDEEMGQHQELKLFADEKIAIDAKIEMLEGSMKNDLETFVKDFSEAGNIILWKRMQPIYESLTKQNDANQSRQFRLDQLKKEATKLKTTIDTFESVCDKCHQPVKDAEEYLAERRKEYDAILKDIADHESSGTSDIKALRLKLNALQDYFQPSSGSLARLKRSYGDYTNQQQQYLDLKERQGSLSELVSEDSAKEIQELATKSAQTSQSLLKKEKELKAVKFQENELERSYSNARPDSTDSNQIDTVFELRDTIKRFIVGIEDTILSYTKRATKEVELEASKVFLELSNAPEAFTGIKLNKQFKARIYGSDNRPVINPSSGMEVMMTLSIIDALRSVSRLDAPVFFDTPARSLDKDHKNGMLNYFWRKDRTQFLIFAHSGEFTVEEIVEHDLASFRRAWELFWPVDMVEQCIHCWSHNVTHVSKNENRCNDCEEITDKRKRQTNAKLVDLTNGGI